MLGLDQHMTAELLPIMKYRVKFHRLLNGLKSDSSTVPPVENSAEVNHGGLDEHGDAQTEGQEE